MISAQYDMRSVLFSAVSGPEPLALERQYGLAMGRFRFCLLAFIERIIELGE